MTGSSVALDTNYAVHVLNDVAKIVNWLKGFSELCIPVTAIGELRFGALKSRRRQENLLKVESLVARCRIIETRAATAERYSQIRFELFRKDRPIPENDLWIAAACTEYSLPLATDDSHFEAVEDLRLLRVP